MNDIGVKCSQNPGFETTPYATEVPSSRTAGGVAGIAAAVVCASSMGARQTHSKGGRHTSASGLRDRILAVFLCLHVL
eukprot:3181927-Amphidinium_carterae.1